MTVRRNNLPGGGAASLRFRIPLYVRGQAREFHISRQARNTWAITAELASLHGTQLSANLAAIRQLVREVNSHGPQSATPPLSVAEVYAAAVLDEVLHLVIRLYRDETAALNFGSGLALIRSELGAAETDAALLEFVKQFPAASRQTAAGDALEYLQGSTEEVPNSEIVLEEMLLLWLANRNPALRPLKVLFDDSHLRASSRYAEVMASLTGLLEAAGDPGRNLLAALLAPQQASPESLTGQLQFLREEYATAAEGAFAALLDQLLLAGDLIREESSARPPGPPALAAPVPTVAQLAAGSPAGEGARYSRDAAWMPGLVLTARNCLVWLGQLAGKYGTEITRLDQIPDAELAELAGQGFSGLWLIGIWQRSSASRRIKQLRGQADAAASAYAVHDYTVADALGGEEALANLQERARRHGIRLASDMVPNHTGMDGSWMAEHPERFIQLRQPPFDSYTFNGPDLSGDPRFQVYLEDHYYDHSDAAVVFKRTGPDGDRFIYHGNDGTSLPWNDTAQLDYLQQEVREAVISKILDVARRFPIIRFDAAMTLARQHIQRLWYPPPGAGGAIPSRTEHGSMAAEVFEQLMPHEFWREVVDRVGLEVPGTLLLAEAFWMMESFFVRTLGMHRVYNSAFMNMLARQANAGFREFLGNILQHDPLILERLVNFMSNPDEESAAVQFGTGDRYFAVAVLLVTLPGLPLFGHGQVEGLTEKYGMEFRCARLAETPDEALLARHEREIFPLMRRRQQFAGASGFELYDLLTPEGTIADNVIAFSNRSACGAASLVLVNNHDAVARGRIHAGRPRVRDGNQAGRPGSSTLLEALGFSDVAAGAFLTWREHPDGRVQRLAVSELRERGLTCELGPFSYAVLLDFRTEGDVAQQAPQTGLSGQPLRGSAGNSDA
jgi:glycosidase